MDTTEQSKDKAEAAENERLLTPALRPAIDAFDNSSDDTKRRSTTRLSPDGELRRRQPHRVGAPFACSRPLKSSAAIPLSPPGLPHRHERLSGRTEAQKSPPSGLAEEELNVEGGSLRRQVEDTPRTDGTRRGGRTPRVLTAPSGNCPNSAADCGMFHVLNMSYEEIRDVTDSIGTVKSRLNEPAWPS